MLILYSSHAVYPQVDLASTSNHVVTNFCFIKRDVFFSLIMITDSLVILLTYDESYLSISNSYVGSG